MTNSFAGRAAYLSALREQLYDVNMDITWAKHCLERPNPLTAWYWRRRLVKLSQMQDILAREIDRTVYG